MPKPPKLPPFDEEVQRLDSEPFWMTDLLSRDRVSDAPVINALSIRGHHVSGLLSFNPNYRLQEALVLKPGKSWLRTMVTGNTPGAQQVELLSRSLVFRSPAAPACVPDTELWTCSSERERVNEARSPLSRKAVRLTVRSDQSDTCDWSKNRPSDMSGLHSDCVRSRTSSILYLSSEHICEGWPRSHQALLCFHTTRAFCH